MTDLITQFALRWGCDHALMTEAEPSHFRYVVQGGKGRSKASYSGEIDSLRLLFNGRWGNYVFQMIHIFHIAEKVKAKRVYLVPTDVFPLAQAIRICGIEIRSVYDSVVEEDYDLVGVFFSERPFAALLDDLTAERRSELARRYVRPLMKQFVPRGDVVEPGSLVIHIRSGDIFQGPDGQGGSQLGGNLYIQAPLSFYQMVVESAFSGRAGRVFIVSENALNPTIMPLVQLLDKLGHAVTLRLNQDLNSDLSWLMAGTKVAFANGTIGIAVALISTEIRDSYFFRHDGTGTPLPVEFYIGDHLRKHFVVDTKKTYIAMGEWRNTKEQRDLMVSFSRAELSWEGGVSLVNVALNKPARQSSLSQWSVSNESQRAVNGSRNGLFAFHTEKEENPWWEVDLEADYIVSEIVIYNRLECANRATSMRVLVRSKTDDAWRLIHDQAGRWFGGEDGCPLVIFPDGSPIAAIRIQLAAIEYLHLDQVEVLVPQRSMLPAL